MGDWVSTCSKGWTERCANATGNRCTCECGGANHGKNTSRGKRRGQQPNLFNGDDAMEGLTPWEAFEPSRGIVREFKADAQEGGNFVLDRSHGAPMVFIDGDVHREAMPRRLVYHSPTGYEWGYSGSGPADLALNILAQFVEPPEAWRWHHRFKFDVLASMPREGGTISAEFVREWLLERWAGEADDV